MVFMKTTADVRSRKCSCTERESEKSEELGEG